MNLTLTAHGNQIAFNPDTAKAVLNTIEFNPEVRKWKEGLRGENKKIFNTIIKTANIFQSIGNALHTIDEDRRANKNVKNYSLVLFGDKVIVAKNCIHKLILTIFGGRTSKVGEKINQYLKSESYTQSRLNQTTIALEGTNMELRGNERIKMESDLDVISKFSQVDASEKIKLQNLISDLAEPIAKFLERKKIESIHQRKIEFIQSPVKDGYKEFLTPKDFPEDGEIVVIKTKGGSELAIINNCSEYDFNVTLKSGANSKISKYNACSPSDEQKAEFNRFLGDNN